MIAIFYDEDHNEISQCEIELSILEETRLHHIWLEPEFATDKIKFIYYNNLEELANQDLKEEITRLTNLLEFYKSEYETIKNDLLL